MTNAITTILGWGGWGRLTALLTAITAIAALWFTSQSLQATQDQVTLTEEGQLTDRFGKAVEQLASEKLDVRLGGIYALERLARDSRRDHPVIVEVLAAFVRTRSPLASCSPNPGPAVDIQAALTVLNRRTVEYDSSDRLDLAHTCLAGANLSNAHFANANLTGADLSRAELTKAELTGALLECATLQVANLNDARLSHINLRTQANIEVSPPFGCIADGVVLDRGCTGFARCTNFSNAFLARADLRNSDLDGGIFISSSLDEANLRGSDLSGVNFVGAYLARANLAETKFAVANLHCTILTEANLTNADLSSAFMKDVDLTDAVTSGTSFPPDYRYQTPVRC